MFISPISDWLEGVFLISFQVHFPKFADQVIAYLLRLAGWKSSLVREPCPHECALRLCDIALVRLEVPGGGGIGRQALRFETMILALKKLKVLRKPFIVAFMRFSCGAEVCSLEIEVTFDLGLSKLAEFGVSFPH